MEIACSISSRILEKITEKNNPLSPRSFVQPPAYSYPSFCKEERQHSKINPEDVWLMSNKSQSGDGMLYPESSHREDSSFKFSVWRLPKWTQAKVTSSIHASKNLNCASLEAYILKYLFYCFWETLLYFNPESPYPQ